MIVGRRDQPAVAFNSARCCAVPTRRSQLARMYSGGPPIWATTVRHLFGGDHFDRVPGADLEIVGVGFLAGDVDADFAADAALQVDLAPALEVLEVVVLLDFVDAIDGADLETGLATGAVVGVDDGELLGQLFARAGFGHECEPRVNVLASRVKRGPAFRTPLAYASGYQF